MRPKQWLKNTLVVAAPLSAGTLLDPTIWGELALAFAMFCLAASGVYLLNDLLDVESDRLHPDKKSRPIASGRLPVRVAWPASIILLLVAAALPVVLGYSSLAAIVSIYIVLQVAYCIWLKHLAVIDLLVVSSGFLLRAIAGAAVIDVPLSQWFLLVMSFGSLFMVAGKRFSEKLHLAASGGATRRSLESYSLSYLRFVWSLSAGIALVAYSLWAFEIGGSSAANLTTVSIVPFGAALLRYAYSVDTGHAGAPEDTVLGDRQLLVLGVIWVLVFAAAVALR